MTKPPEPVVTGELKVTQAARKASRRFYDETDADLSAETLEKLDKAFARFGFALLDGIGLADTTDIQGRLEGYTPPESQQDWDCVAALQALRNQSLRLAAAETRTAHALPGDVGMREATLQADAELVAEAVAQRCSNGSKKDGSPKAPTRHATIWQAARLGAIEYAKMISNDTPSDLTPSALSGDKLDDAERCKRCGHNNPSWSAPSPLWNAVIRGGSIDGEPTFDDMVCASCFTELAEQQGIASGWTVKADKVNVQLETTTPSGRVWNDDKGLWVSALSGDVGEGEDDVTAFEREGRYLVIKKSHLTAAQLSKLKSYMHLANIGTVPAVVVEADWPEYEPVWRMIEKRVAGGAK